MRLITILLICTSYAYADALLYTSDDGKKRTKKIENGEIVIRAPLKKVEITHVVLQKDPNTNGIYWISFHMQQAMSIGIFYHFKPIDDMELNEPFHYSESEFHKEGCSWAIRITSIDKGRAILELVREAYKLDDKHTIDKTKG